jgi:hypothetical protein
MYHVDGQQKFDDDGISHKHTSGPYIPVHTHLRSSQEIVFLVDNVQDIVVIGLGGQANISQPSSCIASPS